MMKLFLSIVFLCVSYLTIAQIEGKWVTVDDETGVQKGIVEFYKKSDGKYYGRITKIMIDLPFNKCDNCTDDRKGKPLVGLEIIRGLEKKGDEWRKGEFLEPKSGETYSCKAKINKKGELEIRAYVGIPLIGRTQIWHR